MNTHTRKATAAALAEAVAARSAALAAANATLDAALACAASLAESEEVESILAFDVAQADALAAACAYGAACYEVKAIEAGMGTPQ